MAMTIKTDGLTEVSEMLAKLGNQAGKVAAKALYQGAGIVADAFTRGTESISTEKFHYLARPDLTGTKRYASPEEKAALAGKSGIAAFRKDGSEVDTVIGFSGNAGYTEINGKRKPVIEIARSINSGTSFMHKQPVYRKAVSQSQGAAKAAIVSKAEEMFNEIINGK